MWRRGDERAPRKPLLVLYVLGRLQAGADRLIPFDELERPLEGLLEEFGPPRKSQHPELPFYHLQTDGVWEIDEGVPLARRKGSRNFLRTELRKWRIGGGFTEQIFEELRRRPEAVRELAREILAGHFPESLHASILDAVGLELGTASSNACRKAHSCSSSPFASVVIWSISSSRHADLRWAPSACDRFLIRLAHLVRRMCFFIMPDLLAEGPPNRVF